MSFTNQIKTVILLALLSALLLWIGSLFGQQGLFISLLIALGMNFFSFWWSDKLVLKMYRSQPITSGTPYELVKEVAEKAQLPMPKVYIIPGNHANAFATGRSPQKSAVAMTEGIVHLLSERELKGVIAHELAHIKNRDTLIATIAATIATVISYIAMFARFSAFFGGRDDSGSAMELLALAFLTPIIATILQLAISRSREFIADKTGASFIQDPEALASALEKLDHSQNKIKGNATTASLFIINPFRGQAFVKWFSTHPPTQDRVKALRNISKH